MVDTLVSGASASRRVGSTPISGTLLRSAKADLFFFDVEIHIFTENSNTVIYEDSLS